MYHSWSYPLRVVKQPAVFQSLVLYLLYLQRKSDSGSNVKQRFHEKQETPETMIHSLMIHTPSFKITQQTVNGHDQGFELVLVESEEFKK